MSIVGVIIIKYYFSIKLKYLEEVLIYSNYVYLVAYLT
jgi:hypothetical protein